MLDKGNLLKVFALVVVIVFVFEMIAIGVLGSRGDEQAGGSQGAEYYNVIVDANATISSFEPFVLVYGKSEKIDSAISRLKSEGRLTYAVPVNDNATTYNLAQGADVAETANALYAADPDAKIVSVASLSMPSAISTKLENGSEVKVVGIPLKEYIDARVQPGSRIGVRFQAKVDKDGQVMAKSQTEFVALPVSFKSSAEVMEVSSISYVVLVPWEQRKVGKQQIESALSSALNSTAGYSERSFLKPNQRLTAGQIASFQALGLPYITRVSADSVSISTEFTDSSQMRGDLGSLMGLVDFPNSSAQIDVPAEPENAAAKVADAMAQFNVSYSLREFQQLKVRIPEAASGYVIPADLLEFTLLTEGRHAKGDEVQVTIDARGVGNLITGIDYATIAPGGQNGAGNQSFNETEFLKCTSDEYCDGIAQTISKCVSEGKCVDGTCKIDCVPYYGYSSYGACNAGADCMQAGCSNEICKSRSEPAPEVSVCVIGDKPLPPTLGYGCACVSGKCRWNK